MATLLGTATLNTAFNVSSDSLLHTFALDKVSQTAFKPPVSAYNTDAVTDFSARLYNDAVEDYVDQGYFNTPYMSETEDFVQIIRTASSPNNPGDNTIYFHFDMLEVDPAATITSIETQVTFESTQQGHSIIPPNGTADELHFGSITVTWADDGPDDSNQHLTQSGPTKITSDQLQTQTITLTPSTASGSSFLGTGLGTLGTLGVKFTGVVRPAADGGAFPGQASLNVKLYNVVMRVNYTGRTRLVTGYQTRKPQGHPFTVNVNTPGSGVDVSAQGYKWSSANFPFNPYNVFIESTENLGFASLLPSDAVVDGTAVLYGLIDYRNSAGTFAQGTATETSNSFRKGQPSGAHTVQLIHGTGSTRTNVSSEVYTDHSFVQWRPGEIHDEPYIFAGEDSANAMGTTRAQAVSENFGIKLDPTQYASGAQLSSLGTGITKPNSLDYAGISPDLFKYGINIAYNPAYISGDVPIDVVSTVTTQGNLTHGVVDSELNDFTGTISLTALGGFLLEATSTISTAITTTPGTTIGLVRSGFTVAMSASFTVPDTTTQFAITAASFLFPSASVSCSAGVSFTTPATSSSAFTTTPGTAIGRIRSGFDIAVPLAFTTPALSDVLMVKAPNETQVYTTPVDTRTHIIPQDARIITLETETRTYIIPEDDRTHELEQETRITTPEALQ